MRDKDNSPNPSLWPPCHRDRMASKAHALPKMDYRVEKPLFCVSETSFPRNSHNLAQKTSLWPQKSRAKNLFLYFCYFMTKLRWELFVLKYNAL